MHVGNSDQLTCLGGSLCSEVQLEQSLGGTGAGSLTHRCSEVSFRWCGQLHISTNGYEVITLCQAQSTLFFNIFTCLTVHLTYRSNVEKQSPYPHNSSTPVVSQDHSTIKPELDNSLTTSQR